MSVVRQLLKKGLSAVLPRRCLLCQGRRDRAQLALTFDDGPHPERTPMVLEHLARYGMRATFFVVGLQVARYPELVREICAAGHAVGHHSYFHGHPEQTSAARLLAEMRHSRELLQQVTGVACNLFRPPQGTLTWRKLAGAWRAGQTVVLWNVDPRDFRLQEELELERWARAYQPAGGDVVLLHDLCELTARGLPAVLNRVREAGLQTVTISEMLAEETRRTGGVLEKGRVPV